MADRTVAELSQKIAQAREVIAHLMDKAAFNGAEAHRALELPVGASVNGEVKVRHSSGKAGWRSVRSQDRSHFAPVNY